jgi:hypothetical protein
MIGMEESAGRSGTILPKPAGTIAPVSAPTGKTIACVPGPKHEQTGGFNSRADRDNAAR